MNYRVLSIAHGTFYIIMGLWPILDMKTFEKVTGPKQDDWLVKTLGILIAVSGATLMKAGSQSNFASEIAANSAGQAFALGSSSLVYSLKGQISKVYLLDTVLEYLLVGLWIFNFRQNLQEQS